MNPLFLTLLPSLLAPYQETETRVFDLSALSLAMPDASVAALDVQLLPLMRDPRVRLNDTFGAMDWSLPDLFAEILADGSDDPPSYVDLAPPSSLVVRGTAAQLERVERILAATETALLKAPRLEITTLSGLAEIPSAVVSSTEFDALVTGAESVSRREVSLVSGHATSVLDLVVDSVSIGAHIQIAQGSSIVDSRIVQFATGLQLDVVPDISNGHVSLGYALTQSGRAENARTRDAAVTRIFTRENGSMSVDDSSNWSETYAVSGGVVHGQADLSVDRVVVIGISSGGSERSYVGLRLANPEELEVDPIAISTDGGQSTWIIPCEHVPQTLEMPTHFDPKEWRFEREAEEALGHGGVFAPLRPPSRPNVYETYDDVMEFWLAEIPGALVVKGESLDNRAIERVRAVQSEPADNVLSVELEVSGVAERARASARFAHSTGSTSRVVAGHESLLATDDSVEVAQFAAAREPRIVTHFEGFAGTVGLTLTRTGDLAYEVRGQVSSDIALNKSSAESAGATGLVAPRTRLVLLDERGVAKANEGGGWTIVVGDRIGASARVTLEVRAHD